MKTQLNTKSSLAVQAAVGQRSSSLRPVAARIFEHRWERRKVREQLRRPDWALQLDDAF